MIFSHNETFVSRSIKDSLWFYTNNVLLKLELSRKSHKYAAWCCCYNFAAGARPCVNQICFHYLSRTVYLFDINLSEAPRDLFQTKLSPFRSRPLQSNKSAGSSPRQLWENSNRPSVSWQVSQEEQQLVVPSSAMLGVNSDTVREQTCCWNRGSGRDEWGMFWLMQLFVCFIYLRAQQTSAWRVPVVAVNAAPLRAKSGRREL